MITDDLQNKSINKPRGAIIFDFDGALADTEWVAMQIVERIAQKKQIPMPPSEFLRSHVPLAIMQRLNVKWWELPYMAYVSRKWAKEINPDAKLFPWSKDLLTSAINMFGTTWIVSTNSPERILKCLLAHGITIDKKHIIGNISFFGKAKHLKSIIQQQQLDPSAVIYVADETRDITAAKEAGITCLSVGWGFQSPEILASMNKGLVLEDPKLFDETVRKILSNH